MPSTLRKQRLPRTASPSERRKALIAWCKENTSSDDRNARGLFIGGPQMPTNGDMLVRLMGESVVESSSYVSDALDKMTRTERFARLQSVIAGKRTRNRPTHSGWRAKLSA